jgi:hypothetical protein
MIKKNFKDWTFYIYAALMLSISIYSYKKAEYNWDMLPYMAVILQYDGNTDIEKIHGEVYSIAKQSVSENAFDKLVDSTSAYRKSVFNNSAEFSLQLPFYVVKPLYTGLCYLFYKCGVSLPKATILPSVISFFLISLILFSWIRKYYTRVGACIFSTLLMLSPFMLQAAKLATPDLLSAILLLSAIYSYLEKKHFNLAALFLLLSIFARLDNVIPVAIITLLIIYIENRTGSMPVWKYILFTVSVLASYLLVSWQAHKFGWSVFYYPDFASHLNPYYDIHSQFSLSGYFNLLKSQLMTGFYYSSLMFFLFLEYILLYFHKKSDCKNISVETFFTIAFVLSITIRFFLQPVMADRFYLAYYLAISIFVLKKYVLVYEDMNPSLK